MGKKPAAFPAKGYSEPVLAARGMKCSWARVQSGHRGAGGLVGTALRRASVLGREGATEGQGQACVSERSAVQAGWWGPGAEGGNRRCNAGLRKNEVRAREGGHRNHARLQGEN